MTTTTTNETLKRDPGKLFDSMRLPENNKEMYDILMMMAKARRETASGTFIPKHFVKTMCDWYDSSLSSEQRREFAKVLASLDIPDKKSLSDRLSRYSNARFSTTNEDFRRSERQLRDALIPYHEDVLQLVVATLPNGMKWVIDLRADVLRALRDSNDTTLRYLDSNIKAMLKNWFGAGFLNLVRVTWEHSPGRLLEKIGAYVVAVKSHSSILHEIERENAECITHTHSNITTNTGTRRYIRPDVFQI